MKGLLLLIKKIREKSKKILPKKLLYFLPLIGLFFLFCEICIINNSVIERIEEQKIISVKVPFPTIAPYPVLNSVLGVKTSEQKEELFKTFPQISAQSAIIVDDDSKVILFSKNANLRFSMASTTKIMTALTALDYFKLNDVLVIKTDGVEGAVVGFKKGEELTFENLLYAMLLPSGNDAALAIAQNYPAGEEEFVQKMNEKAKNFNLLNTHYQDSAGLNDEGDYTTAQDLSRLASIALKDEIFARIVSTGSKQITNANGSKYNIYNLNKLLGIDGVDGVKTGFTDEAGGVLVTSRTKSGHRLIIVVMKSQDRFADTQALLEIAANVEYLKAENN